MGAAIIPIVTAVLGAASARSGQNSANRSNQNLNQQNRDFQRYMSNTAHQRQAKDLEAAGLNRILGVAQAGASTPPGSVAKMESNTKQSSEIIANSALNIAQIANITANTKKTEAETSILTPKATVYGEAGKLLTDFINGFKKGIQTTTSGSQKTMSPKQVKQALPDNAMKKIAQQLGVSVKEAQDMIIQNIKIEKTDTAKDVENKLVQYLQDILAKPEPKIQIRSK